MSSFQYLGVFRSQLTEAEAQRIYAHAALNYKTERELMPQGYSEGKPPKS